VLRASFVRFYDPGSPCVSCCEETAHLL
jgi:hypothetical protein